MTQHRNTMRPYPRRPRSTRFLLMTVGLLLAVPLETPAAIAAFPQEFSHATAPDGTRANRASVLLDRDQLRDAVPTIAEPSDCYELATVTDYDICLSLIPGQSDRLAASRLQPSPQGVLRAVPAHVLKKLDAAGIEYTILGGVTRRVMRLSETPCPQEDEDPHGQPRNSRSGGAIELDSGTVNMYIPDNNGYAVYYSMYEDSNPAPPGAYVTNVEYSTRIANDGSGGFACVDYELYLFSNEYSSQWNSDSAVRVYNNLGGYLDEGWDDDAANDYDIELIQRSTSAFDGQPANQWWGILCWDNWSQDDGMMNYIEFTVHWETQLDVGACCLPDFICHDELTQDSCLEQGGIWLGAGTDCDSADCYVAACCLPDGSCLEVGPSDCYEFGGMWRGLGSTCQSVDCSSSARGACCLPDGTCLDDLSYSGCADALGIWQGAGTTCASSDCGAPEWYVGCGTLIVTEGCLAFQSDEGEVYLLEEYGWFDVGDRVFVEGMVSQVGPSVCFVGQRIGNSGCFPIRECLVDHVDVCGTLVEGYDPCCQVVRTDDGQYWNPAADWGDFSLGDRVRVVGGPLIGPGSYEWCPASCCWAPAAYATVCNAALLLCDTTDSGACCLPDGSCQEVDTLATCTALGGTFHGPGSFCSAVNCDVQTFTIGGAIYTDLASPLLSGIAGVTVTASGPGGTFTGVTTGGVTPGQWQIDDVPQGTYTVTPELAGYVFEHVVGGVSDGLPAVTIEVNAANQAANQSIQFLAIEDSCLTHDMNWDGFVSIVGDVQPFVNVVYFGDYAWYEQQFPGLDPICPGDCNGDGFLSIVGDVGCFVDCVYFGNCTRSMSTGGPPPRGVSSETFTIGGQVYLDPDNPMLSGLEDVVIIAGASETVTSSSPLPGLWQIDDLPEGTYTVTPSKSGFTFEHVQNGTPSGQGSFTIEVNVENQAANQSIQFLAIPVCPGDLDGDNDVDLFDLAALLGTYGTCPGDDSYNPHANLIENNPPDGCIDLFDLGEFLGLYGDICE